MRQEYTQSTTLEHYLVQPIADLLFCLQERDQDHLHQPRTLEISYCVVLIPDLLRLLQAYSGSLHIALGHEPKETRPEDVLRSSGNEELASDIEEIRCVRDAIEHTHVWRRQMTFTLLSMDPFRTEVEYSDFEFQGRPGRNQRERRFGDDRFSKHVNLQTARTYRLGLNVIPTEFTAADMRTILTVCTQAIAALEQVFRMNSRPFYLSELRVMYGPGESVPFQAALDRFCAVEQNRPARPGPIQG